MKHERDPIVRLNSEPFAGSTFHGASDAGEGKTALVINGRVVLAHRVEILDQMDSIAFLGALEGATEKAASVGRMLSTLRTAPAPVTVPPEAPRTIMDAIPALDEPIPGDSGASVTALTMDMGGATRVIDDATVDPIPRFLSEIEPTGDLHHRERNVEGW